MTTVATVTVTIGSQAASNKPATAIDHQPAAIGNIHADARSSRSPPRSGRQIMDTPSPSTASTTAHAVGYNDEPSITAAPLRSTDDLAVDAGQLSSLILTTEATATPQRIVESVTSLTCGRPAHAHRTRSRPTATHQSGHRLQCLPCPRQVRHTALPRARRNIRTAAVAHASLRCRRLAGRSPGHRAGPTDYRPVQGHAGPFAAAGHPPVSRQARHAQGIRQFIRRADHPAHAGTDFATQLAV